MLAFSVLKKDVREVGGVQGMSYTLNSFPA
jgi:hypothetical protein